MAYQAFVVGRSLGFHVLPLRLRSFYGALVAEASCAYVLR